MKLKNVEILNVLSSLNALGQEKFSTKIAFRIASLGKSLGSALEPYEEQRKKLIEEHAEKDKDGNYKRPKEPNGKDSQDRIVLKDTKEFNKKITELSEEEVEVPLSVKLSFDDFDKETVTIAPATLGPLLLLIDAQQAD